MTNLSKYDECFLASCEIIDCYDCLLELMINRLYGYDLDDGTIDNLINYIDELNTNEMKLYEGLSAKDINNVSLKLSNIPSHFLGIKEVRVGMKLLVSTHKLNGLGIFNGDMLCCFERDKRISVIDYINSKIVVDTFLILDRKLSSLSVSSDSERGFVDKIKVFNLGHMIFKFSSYEVSEKLALFYKFDISKIPSLDLIKFDSFDDDLLNNEIYDTFIRSLSWLCSNSLIENDAENVYDNLYFISNLEALLQYLNKEQCENLLVYCSQVKSKNKFVMDNVKRLIKSKVRENN